MGGQGSGLVTLGAADDDSVFSLFDHMKIGILVRLILGAEVPVALDVGDRGVAGEVVPLHVFEELDDPLVVSGPVLLIAVVGDMDRTPDNPGRCSAGGRCRRAGPAPG